MKKTFAFLALSLGVSAAIAAPYSFKAVKPGALVTNDTVFAAVAPEVSDAYGKKFAAAEALFKDGKKREGIDAFFALAEEYVECPALWRRAIGRAFDLSPQIKYTEGRGKARAALLAWPYSKTHEVSRFLDEEARAFEGEGKNKEAVETLLKLQAQPLYPTNGVQTVRVRALNILRDKLQDFESALALAEEIGGDTTVNGDYRAEAYVFAANLVCRKIGNVAEAKKYFEEAMKLNASSGWRTRAMRECATHLQFHLSPRDIAGARALFEKTVADSTYSMSDRVTALTLLLDNSRSDRKPEDKLRYVPFAEKFLADNDAGLKDSDRIRILDSLLKNKRDGGDFASAEELAGVISSCTNFPSVQRRNASSFIASRMAERGDFSEAEKLLRQTYSLPKLGPNEIEATAKDLGNLFILRDDLPGAIKVYEEIAANDASLAPRVRKLVLAAYMSFFRYKEAREYALSCGQKITAAEISADRLADQETAKSLFREVLADENASLDNRRQAWNRLFSSDPELTDKYFTTLLGTNQNTTNALVYVLAQKLHWNGVGVAYTGNFKNGVRICRYLAKIYDSNSACKPDFKTSQYGAMAYCGVGDTKTAAAICAEAIARSRFQPAEIYQLSMMGRLIDQKGSVEALVAEVAKADAEFGKELPFKTRVERIERVGCGASLAHNENLVRALDSYKKSLYKPAPKKRYTVRYSEKPVTGLAAWDSIAVKPEVQMMDRSYGGSMDFLVTDVATGNRGEGISTEQGAKISNSPTMQVVCDAYGIHFRFEAPDEKASDIAAGFVGGGSYEGYIAPGENQPYICTLMDLGPNARLGLYNTQYETTGHRRIEEKDSGRYKSETAFTDKSVVSYFMLSWDAYAALIPENGTEWEFENILWGRAGSAAWNGTESIHGRSTWGRLVFDMPESGRLAILKGQIFKALAEYKKEKRTNHHAEGVVDRWKDQAVGDPEFYEECVKPLVEKLDAYIPLVKVDMSEADVLKVAEEALPGWLDLRFTIQRLRAEYLAKKLSEKQY